MPSARPSREQKSRAPAEKPRPARAHASASSTRDRAPREPSGRRIATPPVVWATAALATAGAVLVRLWFPGAWNERQIPASIFYEGDARIFLTHAVQLIEGVSINNGVPFHPPGWPLVLSFFFRFMGFEPAGSAPVDAAAIKAFMACISGAAVGLTTILAWRLVGFGPMLAVALLGTFHFGHVVQGTVPNSEPLYGLVLVGTLLLAVPWGATTDAGRDAARAPRGTRAFLLGIAAAATALVRAEFLLGAALLGGYLFWAEGARRRALKHAGVFAAGVVLMLTPSTIAHWRSISAFNEQFADVLPSPISRFAPVTSYGGFNFAHGNHSFTDGGTNLDLLIRTPKGPAEEALVKQGRLDITQPVSHNLYVNGYAIGLRWIVEHPADALVLMGRKAAITAGALAEGYLQDNLPVGVDGTRRRVDQFAPARRWLIPVHGALLLGGGVLLWRRPRILVLLLIPLATLAASALLFFGYVRLGVAYAPVVWIFQGVALTALVRLVPWPAPLVRRPALVVAAVGALLLVAEATGAGRARTLYIEAPRGPDGTPIRDATIELRTSR